MIRNERIRILDGCSNAGGASMGFHRAFPNATITGVDILPQPNYPFKFIQADIIEHITKHGSQYDYIHVSPPCQLHSKMTKGLWQDRLATHVDLITPLRPLLQALGIPYDIENTQGAPLINPVKLCGSQFGLRVRRHRLFECNYMVLAASCIHDERPVAVYGHSGGSSKRDGLKMHSVKEWRAAMDIDWMTRDELAQAIPPAYTEHLSQFIPIKQDPPPVP